MDNIQIIFNNDPTHILIAEDEQTFIGLKINSDILDDWLMGEEIRVINGYRELADDSLDEEDIDKFYYLLGSHLVEEYQLDPNVDKIQADTKLNEDNHLFTFSNVSIEKVNKQVKTI